MDNLDEPMRSAALTLPFTSKRRRGVLVLALLALAAVLLLILLLGSSARRVSSPPPGPSQGPPASPAPRGEQFGASVNLLFNERLFSAAQINAQLKALRATGATLARSDALWEAAEPLPPVRGVHHYDWQFDDLIAAALAAHGLSWLPIIDYSAPWAESIPGRDHSPPSAGSGVAGYAAYAAAFVARYGRGGTFWTSHPGLTAYPVDTVEIWNEPDSPAFWVPAPDPAAYANLYQRARAAVLAVSPSTRVIVGGLIEPWSFAPALLAAVPQLRGRIDGVAVHPYDRAPTVVVEMVVKSRATLQQLGLGTVPLYITEFGWTTRPLGARYYAPATARPGLIGAVMNALSQSRCGIAAMLLYTWVSPEHNPRDREQWYGISPPDGGSSADVAAFANAIASAQPTQAGGSKRTQAVRSQRTQTVARAPLLLQPSIRNAACR